MQTFGRFHEPMLTLTDQPREMCGYNPDPLGRVFAYMLSAAPELADARRMDGGDAGADDRMLLDELRQAFRRNGVSRFVEAELEPRFAVLEPDDEDETV